MRDSDTMTFRQFLAACCASVFSPLSRLLPRAVLRSAGFSGWLAPLLALPPLLLLLFSLRRLLTGEEGMIGLAEGLQRRLGRVPGKLLTLLLALWLVFYGGFLLRSGGERLLSTVYHSGKLPFFLIALMGLSTVFAMGKLRWAGRSAAISLLLFGGALTLVLILAVPAIAPENLWPPELTRSSEIAKASLPVADVLSPWVYFCFLCGSVETDAKAIHRSIRAMLIMVLLAVFFIATTAGVMGAELCIRQQFPFFIMLKNLTFFNVVERFDALILAIWMMTDYISIGMSLLSSSEAFYAVLGKGKREYYALPLAAVMLISAAVIANNAFVFAQISNVAVPLINLSIAFVLLPVVSLLPRKKSEKNEK